MSIIKDSVDTSGLKPGTRVRAKADGVYYAAEVLMVSDAAKRSKAPIKVHFLGYDNSYDTWVSVASVRSKLLLKAKPAEDLKDLEEMTPKWQRQVTPTGAEVSFMKSEFKDAVDTHKKAASAFVDKLMQVARHVKKGEADEPLIAAFHGAAGLPQLQDCIFIGHTATDLDSIASAVGAAYLFNGVAAAASELNSETEFALELWGIDAPKPYSEVAAEKERHVVLMDHNQASQMAPGIDMSLVVGIVDHHAIQAGIVTLDKPIYVDIRPWGSACTIIAQMAMRRGVMMPKNIAGLLLSGILSDTLNLQSPTTTSWDRKVASVLTLLAEVKEPDDLASKQFAAKAKALDSLSDYQVITGDCKTFKMSRPDNTIVPVAWGTVETTDVQRMLTRKEDLIAEAKNVRSEREVEVIFVSIVDVVKLESFLILAGNPEKSLASAAFPGCTFFEDDPKVLKLGSRVSRKADFIPPVANVVANGWQPAPDPAEEPPPAPLPLMTECTGFGCTIRRCKSFAEAEMARRHRTISDRDEHESGTLGFQSVFGTPGNRARFRRTKSSKV